jgi:hypothetical protein
MACRLVVSLLLAVYESKVTAPKSENPEDKPRRAACVNPQKHEDTAKDNKDYCFCGLIVWMHSIKRIPSQLSY